jgi:hypothetical protein
MATLPGVTVPWTVSNTLLDIDYIYRWSGNKSISPLLAHLQNGTDIELDDSGYINLAGIVWAYYGTNWQKKWEVLTATYDPLENYNMVETENAKDTDDSNTHVTGSASGNNTSTDASHGVYGYNSSSYVPADYDSVDTQTNTDMSTGYDNEHNLNRTLTRHGNIGVTTSQQMAQSTLDLYAYRFFDEVYKDIDRIVSLPIYDGEIAGTVYSKSGTPGVAAVTSINGKTGDVLLFGNDIDLTSMISQSVTDALSELNLGKQPKPVVLTGTLTAGSTSLTFNNSAITDNSTIDIYMNKSGVNMTDWTQSGTNLTLTFTAYSSDVLITLEVYN